MRELVVEDAVSRAQYEQAKALLQSAEAQVQSLQGQVSLAQNRLSYTRLFQRGRRRHRARAASPARWCRPGA